MGSGGQVGEIKFGLIAVASKEPLQADVRSHYREKNCKPPQDGMCGIQILNHNHNLLSPNWKCVGLVWAA